MKTREFTFYMLAGVLGLSPLSDAGWNDVVTHQFDGSNWQALSLQYAWDSGYGWIWLPQAGVWIYVVEPAEPTEDGMVLVEGGTLATGTDLNGTQVATFHIGRHEVTWGQWQAVRKWAADKGYDIGSHGAGCADDHPVRSVNWYDALKWCNARSQMEGLTPVYTVSGSVYKVGQTSPDQNLQANGYRLPLEAEWEFAALGGNQTNGHTYSGSDELDDVGWYYDNSGGAACGLFSSRGTWPVGRKAANELGLHDMSGNVWEWCWDANGASRRIRGGSWFTDAENCAVLYRNNGYNPDLRTGEYGFRVARNSGQ